MNVSVSNQNQNLHSKTPSTSSIHNPIKKNKIEKENEISSAHTKTNESNIDSMNNNSNQTPTSNDMITDEKVEESTKEQNESQENSKPQSNAITPDVLRNIASLVEQSSFVSLFKKLMKEQVNYH